MTIRLVNPPSGITSGSGAMLGAATVGVLAVGVVLFGPGTTSASAKTVPSMRGTSSEPPHALVSHGGIDVLPDVLSRKGTRSAVAELRRLSGLTWDQLARVFGVSRRALHLWASGEAMKPRNEEHLQRVLGAVRRVDRGSAARNRTLLIGVDATGQQPLDLLAARDYDGFVDRLGSGPGHRQVPPRPSAAAMAEKAPLRPDRLVDARQDRPYPASGRLLGVRTVPIPSVPSVD